jgi:hypothetical protein
MLTQSQQESLAIATLAGKHSPQIATALFLLRKAVGNARMQFQRIKTDAQSLQSPSKGGPSNAWEGTMALFGDIHFLLISLDKVDLLLNLMIRYLPGNQFLKDVKARHQKALKDYNDFRNHLEHIDDRIKRGVRDLGNLGDSTYVFDGQRFDLGPATEREVEDIFSEILKAL